MWGGPRNEYARVMASYNALCRAILEATEPCHESRSTQAMNKAKTVVLTRKQHWSRRGDSVFIIHRLAECFLIDNLAVAEVIQYGR